MKYRTKLYISLVITALASILLGIIIFSIETRKLALSMLKSRSLSIVATAAVDLDPELFAKVNDVRSVDDPIYKDARALLRRYLKANQRNDVYIYDFYTLHPDPKDPTQLLIGVETDQNPDLPGSLYEYSDRDLILQNKETYFVDPFFIVDQYGTWMSAIAPIKDKEGKYVASLVADIDASDIEANLAHILKNALLGLLAAFFLAILSAFFLAKIVTQTLNEITRVVKEIALGNLDVKAEVTTKDEFGTLASAINEMAKGLKERERLKVNFARYVSQHILEKVLSPEYTLKLEGERRKVTLLFSDIRGFTHIAETLPPEEVVLLLNEYFEKMIEVIFKYFGTLDKFIGDGIMAEFGAPIEDPHQEEHAILTAIEMQKELHKLCEKWEKENKPIIEIGIGIHTGEAVIGNIGSEKRIDYTAVGDAVNVASRLENATKIMKQPILISESTYLAVKDKFNFIDLGSVALPGRIEPIRVYTIDLEHYTK